MRYPADNRLRKEIAQQAARLFVVEGLDDFLMAKKKAAEQLGINNKKIMPSNSEIETAVVEYQSLFHRDEQAYHLRQLRQIALKAMELLVDYQPRLVGAVLTGTANQFTEITLHLFSDTPEVIGLYLDDRNIPSDICERRLTVDKQNPAYYPAYKFIADDFDIVLIVLPVAYIKQPPVDPVSGGTMQRGKLGDLRKLVET